MFFLLIRSSSIDICELSLKARMRGSKKLVMLSSDNFFFFFLWGGGAAPVAHHVDFKEYFFELYYPHMSLENTLGNSRRLLKVFSRALLFAGLLHILSPDYIINILTNSISDMCVGMHLCYAVIRHQRENINCTFRLNLLSCVCVVSFLADVCFVRVLRILNSSSRLWTHNQSPL